MVNALDSQSCGFCLLNLEIVGQSLGSTNWNLGLVSYYSGTIPCEMGLALSARPVLKMFA